MALNANSRSTGNVGRMSAADGPEPASVELSKIAIRVCSHGPSMDAERCIVVSMDIGLMASRTAIAAIGTMACLATMILVPPASADHGNFEAVLSPESNKYTMGQSHTRQLTISYTHGYDESVTEINDLRVTFSTPSGAEIKVLLQDLDESSFEEFRDFDGRNYTASFDVLITENEAPVGEYQILIKFDSNSFRDGPDRIEEHSKAAFLAGNQGSNDRNQKSNGNGEQGIPSNPLPSPNAFLVGLVFLGSAYALWKFR